MKFLFCSLSTPGMLFPSIGIALALRQRGHQVAFATNAAVSAALESAGLERIPRGDDDGASFQIELWGRPLSIAMQVKHVEYALQRFQPDVIVSQQLALGPLLAAERHSLPVAVVGLAAYLWPASEALLHRPPETLRERRNLWRYEETTQIYNQVRGMFGMPPSQGDFRSTPLLGDLFLLQSTAELEGDAGDLPERVHLVGACLWEPAEEDPDLERWLAEAVAAGEPILYVHHGRSFDLPSLWPMILEVLGARSVRVAASTLRMDHQPEAIPQHFFVRKHLPQSTVLRHAKAAFATGNTTVVLGALTHGAPLLLSAGGGEQQDIVERCQRAGVAIGLPADGLEAGAVSRALDEVLGNPVFRQRAEHIQSTLQAAGGCERAASLLEHLGQTSRPVLRQMPMVHSP